MGWHYSNLGSEQARETSKCNNTKNRDGIGNDKPIQGNPIGKRIGHGLAVAGLHGAGQTVRGLSDGTGGEEAQGGHQKDGDPIHHRPLEVNAFVHAYTPYKVRRNRAGTVPPLSSSPGQGPSQMLGISAKGLKEYDASVPADARKSPATYPRPEPASRGNVRDLSPDSSESDTQGFRVPNRRA